MSPDPASTHASTPPAAVLWDLDGTLVDTEPVWMDAEHRLCEQFGVTWTHADAEALIGSALPAAGQILHSRGIDLSPAAIVDWLIDAVTTGLGHDVPWQPGALRLLTELGAAGIPCALVTMSYRAMADQILAGAPPGVFHAVVAGDEVNEGKPHPEPYLRGADLLGVDIALCVAVEDSLTGLAAAHSSGAHVIGIQRAVPIPSAPGRSRLLTLEGFGVDGFRRVASGDVIDQLTGGSSHPDAGPD